MRYVSHKILEKLNTYYVGINGSTGDASKRRISTKKYEIKILNPYVLNLLVSRNEQIKIHFWYFGRTRRGEKRWTHKSAIAQRYGRDNYFE